MYNSSSSPRHRSSTLRVKIADVYKPSQPPPVTHFDEPLARKPTNFDLENERRIAQGESSRQSQLVATKGVASSSTWEEQVNTYQAVLGPGHASREAVVVALVVAGASASQDEILECAQTYMQMKEIHMQPPYRIAGAMISFGFKQKDIQALSSALLDM